MAFTSGLYKFQTIHEDEAMQIALSESLHMHNAHAAQEEEEFARAVRMSLLEQISTYPEHYRRAETKSDIESDSGTVRVTVGEGGSVRETLIRALDEGDKVEISLQMEYSDDSEAGTVVPEEGGSVESGEIDLCNEFRREMSSAWNDEIVQRRDELKGGGLEYSAHHGTTVTDEPVSVTDTCYKTQLNRHLSLPLRETKAKVTGTGVTADIQATNIPKVANSKTETANPTVAENGHASSALLTYTMSNDIVIIPPLGTFKRKEHFNPLATRQSIENALNHLSSEWQMIPQFLPPKAQASRYDPSLLGHNTTSIKTPFSITIFPTPTPSPDHETEEERRSENYTSLLRAQRRYAEKLTIPSGPDFRFTPAEWDCLGENLPIDEWEAGFLVGPLPSKATAASGSQNEKYGSVGRSGRKENLWSAWKGKEKEQVGERGRD